MNKKYYVIMTIILIIYMIIFITEGILIGPVIKEKIPSYGGISPDVMPKETKVLIINIAIMLMANIINIFFVIKDKKNNVKKIGLILIILLSIFLIPIIEEGYGYIGGNNDYITIWEMIY